MAVRSYKWGYIRREPVLPPRCDVPSLRLNIPGTTRFDDFLIETIILESLPPDFDPRSVTSKPNIFVQYLDYISVVPPLTIRYRRAGDSFHPMGLGGKKTLKKFFIDRKVPKDKRNSILLFEDCNGLIWVVGYTIDDRVKITAKTQKLLMCQVYKQAES
jgi:tRNA(Ile)-lysidine synthase